MLQLSLLLRLHSPLQRCASTFSLVVPSSGSLICFILRPDKRCSKRSGVNLAFPQNNWMPCSLRIDTPRIVSLTLDLHGRLLHFLPATIWNWHAAFFIGLHISRLRPR